VSRGKEWKCLSCGKDISRKGLVVSFISYLIEEIASIFVLLKPSLKPTISISHPAKPFEKQRRLTS
jgi:hypothetical protein